MKKSKGSRGEMEQLGNIFSKLNVGLPIEHLSIVEVEFLCKFYGENWKQKVQSLLKEHK